MRSDHAESVPPGWWKATCEKIHHPIACINTEQMFIWVNSAFERLVGYSLAELREKTWMEITHQSDVGGALASIEAVKLGDMDSYATSKRYQHKFGHYVPITSTVWKFPDGLAKIMCFVVEAAPKMVTHTELNSLRDELMARFEGVSKAPSGTTVTIGDTSQNDNTAMIRAVMAISVISLLSVIYLAYYLVAHGQGAPPQLPGITP